MLLAVFRAERAARQYRDHRIGALQLAELAVISVCPFRFVAATRGGLIGNAVSGAEPGSPIVAVTEVPRSERARAHFLEGND